VSWAHCILVGFIETTVIFVILIVSAGLMLLYLKFWAFILDDSSEAEPIAWVSFIFISGLIMFTLICKGIIK
jgi:RsiW-degrading membrane proteinase PrsW (M82 family)